MVKKKKAKARKVKTAVDMVKAENVVPVAHRIVTLHKKPEEGTVPPHVAKLVDVLEQKGGSIPEHELLPLLEKHFPEEHVPTFWESCRGVLESMGILTVKPHEPVKSESLD